MSIMRDTLLHGKCKGAGAHRNHSASKVIRDPRHAFSVHATSQMGHAVAKLVEAHRYKSEGPGFDSWWCHWHNPSGRTVAQGSTQPPTEMNTRLTSWDKGGRCVGLTTLPHSCADCLEIWEPQPPGPSGSVHKFDSHTASSYAYRVTLKKL